MLTATLYKLRYILTSLVVILSFSVTVQAHEFWLEPLDFQIEQTSNIQAHIKVGQGLDGDTYAFYPSNFERFELTVENNTKPLKNRFAQKPAVDQPVKSPGLHVLTYQSRFSKLRYDKRETFEKFLRAEGIEWVLEAHEKRGLPTLDFLELYKRFAKSLIKVGAGQGDDRLMGMPFEWVVLTNPYTNSSKKVTAQLFFEKKPFPNARVNVFTKRDGKIDEMKLITDSNGKLEVAVADGGLFLINAVHMIEPDKELAVSSRAAWVSLWASTTFAID